MLIISAIRASTGLYDLYYRADNNLIWFGCSVNPKEDQVNIYDLFRAIEPELAALYDGIYVYVYERKG